MTWSKVTRQERGYGASWDRLRKLVMQRDRGLCQCDQCQGGKLKLMAAHEVDHRIPKAQGGTDDMSNLRAVNRECHKRITIEQQGKTPKAPRAKFDAQGRVLWL